MIKREMAYWELAVALVLVAMLLTVLAPGCLGSMQERNLLNQCAGNLHRLATAFSLYADEYEGSYPPVQRKTGRDCGPNKGVLMFDWEAMAEYVPGSELLVCPDGGPPTDAILRDRLWGQDDTGVPNPCLVDDSSYVYLGWVPSRLGKAGQIVASMEYDALVRDAFGLWGNSEPRDLEGDLAVAQPDGPALKLHRLGTSSLKAIGCGPEAVPVMLDRMTMRGQDGGPGDMTMAVSSLRFNHAPGGSNVLYMDGHVEFQTMAMETYSTAFPVTMPMAALFAALEDFH